MQGSSGEDHLLSHRMAVFALILRTGRANLFPNLSYILFVQAGFTATQNGAVTLSSSVKAPLLHFDTFTKERENMVQASPRECITFFYSYISGCC